MGVREGRAHPDEGEPQPKHRRPWDRREGAGPWGRGGGGRREPPHQPQAGRGLGPGTPAFQSGELTLDSGLQNRERMDSVLQTAQFVVT